MRRGVERLPPRADTQRRVAMAVSGPELATALRELIEALDRRVPQLEQAGEHAIARDSATLRAAAVLRLEALEQEPRHVIGLADDDARLR